MQFFALCKPGTLISVDDVVSAVFELSDTLRITNKTYFIYTSDHGYSLGELNLNWDKRNVYEFDVRVHLLMRGPYRTHDNFVPNFVKTGPSQQS